MLTAALIIVGCAKPTPQDAAKDYVNKQFRFDPGVTIDTKNLEYNVIKKDDDNATIKVSGSIHYSEIIYLVKVGDKWEVKGEGPKAKAIQPEQVVAH
jgi:hypothetical protein